MTPTWGSRGLHLHIGGGAPPCSRAAGTPPPPLLLGGFPPHKGSRLPPRPYAYASPPRLGMAAGAYPAFANLDGDLIWAEGGAGSEGQTAVDYTVQILS